MHTFSLEKMGSIYFERHRQHDLCELCNRCRQKVQYICILYFKVDRFFFLLTRQSRYFNNKISNWMSQLQCKMGSIHINSLSLV